MTYAQRRGKNPSSLSLESSVGARGLPGAAAQRGARSHRDLRESPVDGCHLLLAPRATAGTRKHTSALRKQTAASPSPHRGRQPCKPALVDSEWEGGFAGSWGMAGQQEMMVSSALAKLPEALAVFKRLQNAAGVSGFTAKDVAPPSLVGWLMVVNQGQAAGGIGSSWRDSVGSLTVELPSCPASATQGCADSIGSLRHNSGNTTARR